MQKIIDFTKANGDPFSTLQISWTTEKKKVKQAYKDLAKIYHPDKNVNTKDKFIKIQKAYEFIMDNLDICHQYIEHQKFRQNEQSKLSNEQKTIYEDLQKREQQAEKIKQRDEATRQMKIQEEVNQKYIQLNRLEEQRKLEEQEKKDKQERVLKFELENQEAYKKLNTIKVKWEEGQIFTSDLLQLLFKQYGAIQEIKIKEKKRKGSITFHTTEAANNAVIQGNDGLLKVKHGMKAEKRQQLQEMLKSSKEKLNRKNDDVLHLSSDTLKRISHFYNKDSKIVIDHEVNNLQREQERLKLIKQIYDEELNN